jgi:phytanoyl-CoA hydroxylase
MTIDVARYAEDGYLVLEGALGADDVERAREALTAVIARVQGELAAGTRDEPDFWSMLRRSGDRVDVFRDPGAPFDARDAGSLERATMRVGHALHRDPLFGAFTADERLRAPLRAAVGEPAELVTTAVIYKQPRSSTVQFGLHQDAWYLTTDPETLHLAYVALDDMDPENGCLEVVPGSHRGARVDAIQGVSDRGFVTVSGEAKERGRDRAIALSAPRGTVVLVHGRCYHGSGPNRSDRPRRGLILHAKAARSRFHPACWVAAGGRMPALAAL